MVVVLTSQFSPAAAQANNYTVQSIKKKFNGLRRTRAQGFLVVPKYGWLVGLIMLVVLKEHRFWLLS